MSKASKKFTSLTPEEADKLAPLLNELGLEMKVVYETKCELCGKKFTSKDKKLLDKKLKNHIDEKCATAKWMRAVFKILEIMGLKNVKMGDVYYVQEGKFLKGYERTKPEELDMLNRAKVLFEEWGKE